MPIIRVEFDAFAVGGGGFAADVNRVWVGGISTGTKRAAHNTFDQVNPIDNDYIDYDFDNGQPVNDAIPLRPPSLGLGQVEGGLGRGDSGGPALVKDAGGALQIVGIAHSVRSTGVPPDVNNYVFSSGQREIDFSFGETGAYANVQNFKGFVKNATAGPYNVVLDMNYQVIGVDLPGENVVINARLVQQDVVITVVDPLGAYSGEYYRAPLANVKSLLIRGSPDSETLNLDVALWNRIQVTFAGQQANDRLNMILPQAKAQMINPNPVVFDGGGDDGDTLGIAASGAQAHSFVVGSSLIKVDGADLVNFQGVPNLELMSGVFNGNGTFQGRFLNNAQLGLASDAGGAGLLTVNGYSQTGAGTLNIDLGVSSSDLLTVNGTVSLAGGLGLGVLSLPLAASHIVIANDGSDPVSGTFDALPEGALINVGGHSYRITYHGGDGNDVVLEKAGPGITIADASQKEGTGSLGQMMTFTAKLDAPSTETVTVRYSTANGTAVRGLDYSRTTGTIEFPAGSTEAKISVPINPDTKIEPDEFFFVNLSSAVNGVIVDGRAIGTILNDDTFGISVSNASMTEGNSGTKLMTFTATLNTPSPLGGAYFRYATTPGSARPNTDYVSASGLVRFFSGQTIQTFTVPIIGDTTSEPHESFTVNLFGAVGAPLVTTRVTGTILNDDGNGISVSDAFLLEGNSGTKLMTFSVNLVTVSSQKISVDYATSDGSATAGEDYASASGTVTIPAGKLSQTFTVPVFGDTTFEQNETFTVALTSATAGISIVDGQGVGTITNDDATPPAINISDFTALEGTGGTTPFKFNVTLASAYTQTTTVHYKTVDGSATAPEDYTAIPDTLLTFSPGETTKEITVSVVGDAISEPPETFYVDLSGAVNAIIVDGRGEGRIVDDDPPTISIRDVTLVERDANSVSTFFLLVSLSRPPLDPTQPVTVQYSTANGTATEPGDYLAVPPASLTFAPGALTAIAGPFTVFGDTAFEPDETFFVNLSSPSANATIADGQGVVTITNDDTMPTISINDVTLPERNSSPSPFTFTVSLSNQSYQPVTVNYATANGTATEPGDYTGIGTKSLTFNPGETSKTITVDVVGDTAIEPDETFTVDLSGQTNATIADAQGVGTITNDDFPTLSIDDVTRSEGNSGTTSFSFTVSLSSASPQTVTANYSTANGTATVPSDYASAFGSLTFIPGDTSETVNVNVAGDTTFEPNEYFFVHLSSQTNATIADSQGIGTISNDDSLPAISVNDVARVEGNSGTATLTFTVSLSNASSETVTVSYSTADGSATTPGDYASVPATLLTFNAGETSKTVTVNVLGDTTFEPSETFFVNLVGQTNATIADSQGVGTITNDDSIPTISINDVTLSEGNIGTSPFTFTVSLSNASSQTITVSYSTADVTATEPGDYAAISSTLLTFNPGEISKTVTVNVVGDSTPELTEAFTVNLASATNATIADGQGVGTITNDDSFPSLSVGDVSITEGNSGTSTMFVPVTLNTAASQTVVVNFTTADFEAIAGEDYIVAQGILVFAPGQTSQTIAIAIFGDTVLELNEQFYVNLFNPSGATIGDGQGVETILNDEPQLPTVGFEVINLSSPEGTIAGNTFGFVVKLSPASNQTVTVGYTTVDGTAKTSDLDYAATSGTLTFLPGETSKGVPVSTIPDTKFENNESFTVLLTSVTNASATTGKHIATGTIVNDDTLPTITLAPAPSLNEGNSGQFGFPFLVTLSSASGADTIVHYRTVNGTATAGSDFVGVTDNVLTIPAGQTSGTIMVMVNGDTVIEPDETFSVQLFNATNGVIGSPSQVTATILNDDTPITIMMMPVSSIYEGSFFVFTPLLFTVGLSAPSSQTVTVQYATADGSAFAGSDYQAQSGTLTFLPGVQFQGITINVFADTVVEPDENFFVNLSNPTNATLGISQGEGIILNDDAPMLLAATTTTNSAITTAGATDSTQDAVLASDLGDSGSKLNGNGKKDSGPNPDIHASGANEHSAVHDDEDFDFHGWLLQAWSQLQESGDFNFHGQQDEVFAQWFNGLQS